MNNKLIILLASLLLVFLTEGCSMFKNDSQNLVVKEPFRLQELKKLFSDPRIASDLTKAEEVTKRYLMMTYSNDITSIVQVMNLKAPGSVKILLVEAPPEIIYYDNISLNRLLKGKDNLLIRKFFANKRNIVLRYIFIAKKCSVEQCQTTLLDNNKATLYFPDKNDTLYIKTNDNVAATCYYDHYSVEGEVYNFLFKDCNILTVNKEVPEFTSEIMQDIIKIKTD